MTRALALGGLKPEREGEPRNDSAHYDEIYLTDYALNAMPYAAGMVVRSWLEDDPKRANRDPIFQAWRICGHHAAELRAILRMVGQ
jgi:hypothetical protein